jgi:hypothetical protein
MFWEAPRRPNRFSNRTNKALCHKTAWVRLCVVRYGPVLAAHPTKYTERGSELNFGFQIMPDG